MRIKAGNHLQIQKERMPMWKILVILLCLTALILLVVMICDSNRFVKVSYRISDRRLKKKLSSGSACRSAQQIYGKHNEKLLAAIKSVIGSDSVHPESDYLPVRKVNGTCKGACQGDFCRVSIYYANGNHEYRIYREPQTYGKMGASYRAFLKGNHVRILENGSVLLPEYGIRITRS